MELNNDLILCGVFPATMEEKGGHIGGVNCENGMILGNYVLAQSSFPHAYFSLTELVVYGMEEIEMFEMVYETI